MLIADCQKLVSSMVNLKLSFVKRSANSVAHSICSSSVGSGVVSLGYLSSWSQVRSLASTWTPMEAIETVLSRQDIL